jgi:hypothetical protein
MLSGKVYRSKSLNLPKKSKARAQYPHLYALDSTQRPSLPAIPVRRDSQDSLDVRQPSKKSRNGNVDFCADVESNHEENPEANTCSARCSRVWRVLRVLFLVASLVTAVCDIVTDWWAVTDYITYDGEQLTIALTFFTSVSTLLFVVEMYNGITALRIISLGLGDLAEIDLWREVLSLTLLMMEDFPVTVIMYAAFRWGNCPLYIRIFEDTFLARLSLLAAFGSSLFKGLLSLKYCVQVVAKEDYTPWRKRKRRKHSDVLESGSDIWKFRQSGLYSRSRSRPSLSRQKSMTWQDRCFCCSCVRCRPLRFIVNITVCAFTAWVCLTFIRQDIHVRRPECAHLVATPSPTTNFTSSP